MEYGWEGTVRKLAAAYETGWEYVPGGEEPGSVLMDIFLEMAEGNQARFNRIWEKQELAFLQAVSGERAKPGGGRGALLVSVSGEEDGRWLKEGTPAYASPETGEMVRFLTAASVRLTSARLKYAIYHKGLSAWLAYEQGARERLLLFQPVGEALCRPVFGWWFSGAGDGQKEFDFRVDFGRKDFPGKLPGGKWSVSDEENEYELKLQWGDSGFLLRGDTPDFAHNLSGKQYEIKLEFLPGEEPGEEWLDILSGGFILRKEAEEREPDLCLTDFGAGGGGKIRPFGDGLEEASCCYFACDRILAGGEKAIAFKFRESFEIEEKLPEPPLEELKKYYKKYPWMRSSDTVQEWQAEDTVWEYFNGNLWKTLPGSEAWHTLLSVEEAGDKTCEWKRPSDMKACSVEGEEHFYIRLRLGKTRGAYAPYYRKAIPVFENIRFSAEECHMEPLRKLLPELILSREEKMYLGFDRAVASGNRWYTGDACISFDSGQIKGADVLMGKEAFWVELSGKEARNPACFLPNYVPICQVLEERAEHEELRIEEGTEFFLEPSDMGMLEAVCPREIRCGTGGAPILLERQAAEHFFSHFGRMLTPMDVESMLQERYPYLKVDGCVFQREHRTLNLELELLEEGAKSRTEELCEEMRERLPEIEEWLEGTVSGCGALWMRNCRVRCKLRNVIKQEKES